MAQIGITSKENPFDFFNDYNAWSNWESSHASYPMEWVARIESDYEVKFPDDEELNYERAIDDVVRLDPFQRYIKVTKE